ncbi:hypothetical protein [Campylobacter showae]|uniref:hypothetical protein n=1 Tax=Campylobacter showae TaxID=204 RepID=UPI000F095581|nr:hypothetical protein [Campylobacter showae]
MIQGRIHTKSKDYKKAAEILSPMREDGNQDACALYGKVLKENNKPQQAIKLYKQACDKGSARGCELLGDYYEIRSKQAYFYANKACEIDKQRCLLLGGILYFEDKFVQSFKAAEKSCYSQKYYISSCLMAAMAYENKLKNFMKKPKKLYSTLCERAPHRKEDFCAEAR